MGRLDGKVALISGGARGMGAAEARLFVREGAKVVIGDVLDEPGAQVEAEINENGGEATYLHLDVTNSGDWQRAVETAQSKYGHLDILVNNAGIVRRFTIEETTEEIWDEIMAVNAKGVFLGTKQAIPAMRQAGGGSIVNISSISGLVSIRPPAYIASKGPSGYSPRPLRFSTPRKTYAATRSIPAPWTLPCASPGWVPRRSLLPTSTPFLWAV